MGIWRAFAPRPAAVTRTDLTYLPGTDGQPVYISPVTITTATLLTTLTDPHGTAVPRSTLRQQWAQQFPDDNQSQPLPQHTPHTTNTLTTRRISKALNALDKLGAIHRDRHHITITDHAILTRIATLE